MKKYLLTSAAALAFCGLFTSCTHDLGYDGESYAQNSVVKTYEQAFITAFGQPDPNNDWGFGSNNSSTRAFTRAVGTYSKFKGNMTSSFNFPGDCDASKFLAAVPGGVQKMPANGEVKGGTYYIDNTTTKVNMNTGAGVIYVDGTVDLSSDNCFEITQNTEIYLVNGSTLKLGTNDANKLKAIIYIESTATLETANRLKMDNTSKVYNHGTINAGAFEVNNTSFLYNVGTLNAPNGLVYVANNNSSIVNDGTIIAGDVEVAGSGHVQNNAEWTVNGTTTVNSNDASWVNNGHWTTDYYSYTAGSENVINNCFLEVNEDFDINLSDGGGTRGFKIDAGGGVLTKNFNGGKKGNSLSGPYRVMMGSNAVFKVTGTAALASANVGTWQGGPTYGYGFYGVGDDYAVFQATHIVKGQPDVPGDKKVQYGGKLYVSAEDHFASELDPWNQVITFSLGFTKANIFTTNPEDEYSTGKPDITIEETPCNPGFGDDPKPSSDIVRVICEDLSVKDDTDWDFNDAVFDVQLFDNYSKVKITLRAAGGTLPLYIGNDNEAVEIHAKFKEFNDHLSISTGTMLSTGTSNSTGKYTYTGCNVPYFFINNTFGSEDVYAVAKNIPIKVQKLVNGESQLVTLPCEPGLATAKVAVNGGENGFEWCDEREHINDKYRNYDEYGNEYGGFSLFVQGFLNAENWHNYQGPLPLEMVQELLGH